MGAPFKAGRASAERAFINARTTVGMLDNKIQRTLRLGTMQELLQYGCVLLCVACGSTPRQEQNSDPKDPAVEFSTLEDRLLQARTVRLDFHVTADGAFAADLRGGLHLSTGDGVRLTAVGEFAGQAVDLVLQSADGQYEFGNGTDRNSSPEPEHLKEALLIGLTRMGIMHNLARLTGAAPPDHADGGVREWVVVDSFVFDPADSVSVSFDLAVAGEPSGSASLEIDPSGLPVVRRQTVQFPSGEMRVVERYTAVTINP